MTDALLKAAKALLAEIELRPGGYDFRPYYELRPKSQLNDPDGAVIRLRTAVDDAGSSSVDSLKAAAEFARSAIDGHLGDSDLPNGSDDPLFIACQKLSEALS